MIMMMSGQRRPRVCVCVGTLVKLRMDVCQCRVCAYAADRVIFPGRAACGGPQRRRQQQHHHRPQCVKTVSLMVYAYYARCRCRG